MFWRWQTCFVVFSSMCNGWSYEVIWTAVEHLHSKHASCWKYSMSITDVSHFLDDKWMSINQLLIYLKHTLNPATSFKIYVGLVQISNPPLLQAAVTHGLLIELVVFDVFIDVLVSLLFCDNVGKTMSETSHDWEWLIAPVKMVMTSAFMALCFTHMIDIQWYIHSFPMFPLSSGMMIQPDRCTTIFLVGVLFTASSHQSKSSRWTHFLRWIRWTRSSRPARWARGLPRINQRRWWCIRPGATWSTWGWHMAHLSQGG